MKELKKILKQQQQGFFQLFLFFTPEEKTAKQKLSGDILL